MWLDHLPASVAFCDVETTGVGKHDRIVSFGGIGMTSRNLANGRPDLEYLYLVFDPSIGNRRGAEEIHGFSSAVRLPICTTQSRTRGSRCKSIFGCTAARFSVDGAARFLACHPTCVTPRPAHTVTTRAAQIRRSVTEPGRLLPCRSTPYSSLLWTAGEPREDEGAHEVIVAVKAFVGPE